MFIIQSYTLYLQTTAKMPNFVAKISNLMFLGLSIYAWIVLLCLAGKAVAMATGKVSGDMISLAIIIILLVTGALPSEEALSCFSSPLVVLIGVLCVIVAGLVHTGVVRWITDNMLGTPKTLRGALIRLMFPVAILSAFLDNNTVAAMFVNVVKQWCKKINIKPSKLILPVSYAAGFGAVCTIIGASSNLLIAQFYKDIINSQMPFFAPAIPGIACFVVGVALIIAMRKYLPDRKTPEDSFESSSNYTVELLVPSECESIGMTVQEAGLLNVVGGHLIEIVRFDREITSPVPPDEFILGGDHLVYSGNIQDLLTLKDTHGLVNATHHVFHIDELDKNRQLQMATISMDSPLAGDTMQDSDFEAENNVVLVAVARQGENIKGIPREVRLRAGDTLLFEGQKLKPSHFTGNLDFFDNIALPQINSKTAISSAIVIAMVLLSAFNVLPLLNSCMLAAAAMAITRCCSLKQIQSAINWKTVMVFAGAVCLGKGIEHTGLAMMVGTFVQEISGTNSLLALILLSIVATICTQFISNTTTAAVFIPIALKTAITLGANPMAFAVSLLITVSSSFSTPFSSETNTLVYGPGGYKFIDYVRLGVPMNIVILIVNILMVSIVYPL